MKNGILILLVLLSSLPGHAKIKKTPIGHLPWAGSAKQMNTGPLNICGNHKIQLTTSSIEKNFLVGQSHQGFYLSGLISHDDYWEILKTTTKAEAEDSLRKAFAKTELWRASGSGEVKSSG